MRIYYVWDELECNENACFEIEKPIYRIQSIFTDTNHGTYLLRIHTLIFRFIC